jgi:hypothetical protein
MSYVLWEGHTYKSNRFVYVNVVSDQLEKYTIPYYFGKCLIFIP